MISWFAKSKPGYFTQDQVDLNGAFIGSQVKWDNRKGDFDRIENGSFSNIDIILGKSTNNRPVLINIFPNS